MFDLDDAVGFHRFAIDVRKFDSATYFKFRVFSFLLLASGFLGVLFLIDRFF
jgi:hypothetical protein